MAYNSSGSTSSDPHVRVLVTYWDDHGRQLLLPQASMRESFTGLQALAQQVLGTTGILPPNYSQNLTIMHVGLSSFEIEIRATASRKNRQRGRSTSRDRLVMASLLDHLTNVLIELGQTGCYLASHPDAQVRHAGDCYGPYYETVDHGRAIIGSDGELLEMLVREDSLDGLRALMANLKQPGVAYATLTKHAPGLLCMRRIHVYTNDHLREFANGAPLGVDRKTLEAARSRAAEEPAGRANVAQPSDGVTPDRISAPYPVPPG